MKRMSKTLMLSLITGVLLLSACEQEGPMERTGESVDETFEDAGDSLEDAGDSLDN